MTSATATLPTPTKKHATCAWCRCHFDTILELIDHVDRGHVEPAVVVRPDEDRAAA